MEKIIIVCIICFTIIFISVQMKDYFIKINEIAEEHFRNLLENSEAMNKIVENSIIQYEKEKKEKEKKEVKKTTRKKAKKEDTEKK